MVFTARIRRSVVMPIDEPVAGCSPTKWHWSQERFDTQDLDGVASDYSKATQDQGYRLPVELLAIVAEYLILDSAHKTCAALNQTCNAVRQETTATLWRTISAWNPPRYAHSDSAEDEMQMQEINDRWGELIAAPGTKYTEFLLIPPFALDQPYKEFWLHDDYPFSLNAHTIFPRLKAFVYFEEFISGPRLILAQPHLHICKGYLPCAGDLEGSLRLVAMAPEVRGTTMVRPPWTIRVPESATAVSLHEVGRGFMLFAPEDVEDMLDAQAEEGADGDLEEEAQAEAETEPLDPDDPTETADEDRVEDETQTTDDESQCAWPSELLDTNASPELMDQDSVEDEIDTTDSSEQARLALASDDFFDETRGPAVDESDATDSSNRAGRPGDFDDFFDEERQDRAFLADSSRSPEPLYSDIEPDGLDEELGDEENDDLDVEDEVPPVDTATQDKASFDSFWDRAPDAETPAKKPIGEDTSMSRLMNAYGTVHGTPEAYAAALTALYARVEDDEETKRTKASNNLRFAKMRFERKECARSSEPRGVKRKDLEDSDDDGTLDVDEALDAEQMDEVDTEAEAYESDAFSTVLKEFIAKHCKFPAIDEDETLEDFTAEEVDTMHEGILEWLADQSQILDQDPTEDDDHRFLRIVNRYIEWMNDQDEDLDYYIDNQYAPLDTNHFSKSVAAGLSETFPYPLTIVEFSPTYLGRHENRVASIFVEMLRLAMSLPQNKMTKRFSFRNLLANEVIACIESYQPLIVLHPEFACLKLEFQILDYGLEDQTPFEDCVTRVFEDIRDGLFAISCRGTPLEKMGTFDITREADEQVEDKWYLRVLPQQRLIGWGTSPKEPFTFSQVFPDDDDAYGRLQDQYARSLQ
ncbi:hypothetical protein QFC20_007220 [Naganishia adeliensis]|uniref:Uncharacterized protein n=1 Tax=Naganishia adeliensis TaxID=92952 RepID=A0ACC2V1I5_9TREE|nr:hypothetical protein QFC20_007220 [Naganishia adeliensis]